MTDNEKMNPILEQLKRRAEQYVEEHPNDLYPAAPKTFAASIKEHPEFTEEMLVEMIALRDAVMLKGQARWVANWLKARGARLLEEYTNDRSMGLFAAAVLEKAIADLSAGKEP